MGFDRMLISYFSLNLLRSFYSEGLVDNRTVLQWLVIQLASCNLAQAGFLARLADEYLDGILICRALARPFIDACLTKISEVILIISYICVNNSVLTTVIDLYVYFQRKSFNPRAHDENLRPGLGSVSSSI